LEQRKFAAIGEIGLDFYWDKTFTEQQIAAFEQQIDWAKEYQLPIVIHSRDAMQECIEVIRKKQDGHLKGIFHCFSGTEMEARQIIDLGFYLGIGGVITYKKAGLAELLEKIELSVLVLETDSPYLTPAPFRGKRNESSYLKYIAAKLAEVKQTTIEEVARVTTENARIIFGD
jgi:TatD DNase family protein